MSEPISLRELREGLAANQKYTNPWADFCPGPDAVLALVEAVEATLACRYPGSADAYREAVIRLDAALAHFTGEGT